MAAYKKLTISVRNDELDALEDLCVVDFDGDENKHNKARRKSLRIWNRLVREYDRPGLIKSGVIKQK